MTYELYAIRFATDVRTYSEQYYRYQAYREPDRPRPIDFFTWVAISPGRVVVIDTGCTPQTGAARGLEYLGEPHRALEALPVDPATVETVVLTHLHYDHVGCLDAYPAATFHLSEAELAFWTGPNLARLHFQAVVDLDDLIATVRLLWDGRLRFTHEGRELVPGITTHAMPGHTVGQLALVIETARGPIVLASDSCHYYEEVEHHRPFTVFSDLPALYDSYERLHWLAGGDVSRIVPGHDPDVCARHERIARAAGCEVVRIA